MNDYEQKHILTAIDGVKVVSILHMPDSSPKGACLLLHGIGTNKDEYLGFFAKIALKLAEAGIASLRLDFRGHGESPLPPDAFTISSQLLDAQAGLSFLRERTTIAKPDLFGCSFGAPPCLYLKAWVPAQLGRITLLAPVLNYRKVFLDPVSDWGKTTFPQAALRRCLEAGKPVPIGENFYMSPVLLANLMHADVEGSVSLIEEEFTVLHGVRDDMVPISLSQDVAARHPHLRLIEFPNMEHGFTDSGDETGESPATLANIEHIMRFLVPLTTQ